MKTHAAELARIAKNQRTIFLLQDKMIMLSAPEIRRLRPHCSTHAQMKADEIVARKTEKHLLPARDRGEQTRAGQSPNECSCVRLTEDSFPRMQLHGQNFPRRFLRPIACDKYSTSANSGMSSTLSRL